MNISRTRTSRSDHCSEGARHVCRVLRLDRGGVSRMPIAYILHARSLQRFHPVPMGCPRRFSAISSAHKTNQQMQNLSDEFGGLVLAISRAFIERTRLIGASRSMRAATNSAFGTSVIPLATPSATFNCVFPLERMRELEAARRHRRTRRSRVQLHGRNLFGAQSSRRTRSANRGRAQARARRRFLSRACLTDMPSVRWTDRARSRRGEQEC